MNLSESEYDYSFNIALRKNIIPLLSGSDITKLHLENMTVHCQSCFINSCYNYKLPYIKIVISDVLNKLHYDLIYSNFYSICSITDMIDLNVLIAQLEKPGLISQPDTRNLCSIHTVVAILAEQNKTLLYDLLRYCHDVEISNNYTHQQLQIFISIKNNFTINYNFTILQRLMIAIKMSDNNKFKSLNPFAVQNQDYLMDLTHPQTIIMYLENLGMIVEKMTSFGMNVPKIYNKLHRFKITPSLMSALDNDDFFLFASTVNTKFIAFFDLELFENNIGRLGGDPKIFFKKDNNKKKIGFCFNLLYKYYFWLYNVNRHAVQAHAVIVRGVYKDYSTKNLYHLSIDTWGYNGITFSLTKDEINKNFKGAVAFKKM